MAGRPLTSFETLVQCIASATTTTGLTVHAEYDEGPYPTGIVVTDEEFQALHVNRDGFHGEWNYTITPRASYYDEAPKLLGSFVTHLANSVASC